MHVEFDADWPRFKIQKEPYGSVVIVNFSSPFDSFEVIDDQSLWPTNSRSNHPFTFTYRWTTDVLTSS